MVNEGYDVWLGNSRGNKHSNHHVTLKTKSKKFWDFCFEEMGMHDITSVTNYILSNTGLPNLTYIGHSQGCTQFMILCSNNPEFCAKNFNGFIALGPAIYLDHSTSYVLKALAELRIDIVLKSMGINSVFTSAEDTNFLTKTICKMFKLLCNGIADILADGVDAKNNQDRLKVFYAHFPSGTSSKDFVAFGNLIRQKDFISPDSFKPYPLENFKVKTYAKIGLSDLLADPVDCKRLQKVLENNGVLMDYKEYPNMGHLSFFMTDGNNTYIKDVIENVKSLNNDN